MKIGDIMGWVGTVLSMVFYIAPIIPITKLIKKKCNLEEVPGPLLIMSFMNTIIWTTYGLRGDKTQVFVCNGLGGIISVFFIIIYLIYLAKQNWKLIIMYNFIFANFIVEIFYIFYKIIKNNNTNGLVAMIFNILMYASPGAKIYEVCKTGNYDLIPIYSCIVSVFNCISWFIHGLFLEDINIIIPNGSGIVLAIVQVLVWGVFYKKNKNKKILDTQIIDKEIKNENNE
jgi:solute carrier family 50 protein (sugar transporter)